MGYGDRKNDAIPYRSMGPVTVEEYESRQDRYDKQLQEKLGINPMGMSTVEKVKILREFRENEYSKLQDAAYKRRGWNQNGIPTVEHLKEIGMDLPEVLAVVEKKL
jgi:aldehyde:ferredoxin oxidoreductase